MHLIRIGLNSTFFKVMYLINWLKVLKFLLVKVVYLMVLSISRMSRVYIHVTIAREFEGRAADFELLRSIKFQLVVGVKCYMFYSNLKSLLSRLIDSTTPRFKQTFKFNNNTYLHFIWTAKLLNNTFTFHVKCYIKKH